MKRLLALCAIVALSACSAKGMARYSNAFSTWSAPEVKTSTNVTLLDLGEMPAAYPKVNCHLYMLPHGSDVGFVTECSNGLSSASSDTVHVVHGH